MQSELSDEKLIENPANVEAKLKTAEAVAGVAGAGWDRCFPPTT